jgi:amidase
VAETAAKVRLTGKTNLHELAYGTTGVNVWFGTPHNPGGSVRIPAACCGVAGLKTTWGRIPLDGVWPLAPSLGTVGPIARDVGGLALGMRLLEPGYQGACNSSQRRAARSSCWVWVN